MPDVCRANGFSETLKIGRLAAAHQIAVSPHVVHELSLQVAGALSNGFLVEWIDWVPDDLFAEMPAWTTATSCIPDRPGHGMALAPGAERKYRRRLTTARSEHRERVGGRARSRPPPRAARRSA